MQPYGLEQLVTGFGKITNDMVLYLPRTSNLNQIAKYVPEGEQVQATHYCMNGASKVSGFSIRRLRGRLALMKLNAGAVCFLRRYGEN